MKIPQYTVPILVIAATLAGLGIAEMFAIPTVEIDFASAPLETTQDTPPRIAVVKLLIPAVRCADTARSAAGNLEEVDGVLSYVSFASHNRVEITYDPGVTDPSALIEAIEGPVYDATSGEFHFGVFVVAEILEK